jgi:probable F420-dependent oxidoreductase
MKFWQAVCPAEIEQCCDLARIAEEFGYTGLAMGDHLMTPGRIDSSYPYAKGGALLWDPSVLFPDPWQMISIMATATRTLEFMTSIYILPLRDVFTAAKAISTSAVISGNRVTLGAGSGWMKEEFDIVGQPFHNRGSRSAEMLDIIERLMRGGMVEYHGKHYDFPPVQMSPVPSRPVPVMVGGETPNAMRRAAKWNGWISAPHDEDIDAIKSRLDLLTHIRRELGGEDKPFEILIVTKTPPSLDFCRRLEELGVTMVMPLSWYLQGVPTSSLDYKRKNMESFAENVIRQF